MHVPDGFIDPVTSLVTVVVAAVVIGWAVRRSPRELRDRTAPLAGLTAAYIFAVQMLNFPVGAGTSGHLMGGALAAVLVGPATATLVITVVLVIQALLFADGGLTAIGTNVLLMAVTTPLVGWAVARMVDRALLALQRAAGREPSPAADRRRTTIAAGLGGVVSVPAAALVFTVLYGFGGTTPLPMDTLLVSMVGWHTLIGLGEGLITALTVGAVMATRPDLVHFARGRRVRTLQVRQADGSVLTVTEAAGEGVVPVRGAGAVGVVAPRPRDRRFAAAVLTVIAVLAGGVSALASAAPDGLEYVTGQLGVQPGAAGATTWLADYGAASGVAVGVAGLIGVAVTLLVAGVGFRRLAHRTDA